MRIREGEKLSLGKGDYSASILLNPRPQEWAGDRCNEKIIPKIWNSVRKSLNNLFYFYLLCALCEHACACAHTQVYACCSAYVEIREHFGIVLTSHHAETRSLLSHLLVHSVLQVSWIESFRAILLSVPLI